MSLRSLILLLLVPPLGACSALPFPATPGARTGALEDRLETVLADTALDHAHWGVLVRSLASGETLFTHNADKLFVPASNMKLITGAAVLEALGPDYRYRTEVGATGPVQAGVLHGSLVVRGTGDPTLSARFGDDPRLVFRAWADSLRARGITRVAGGIVGVDSAFADGPVGAGWAWDDLHSYYAAEFGALQFNEGAVEVQLFPSATVGEPGIVALNPPTQYVPVVNRTVTTAPGTETRLRVSRDPVGPGITVTGQIAADTLLAERAVAVRDPTAFYLATLRETLREAGVVVEGAALDADQLPAEDLSVWRATPLFVHRSPPLREILPAMLQPSQNWIAETLLRTLGRELRGEGTADAGEAVVDSLFTLWSLPVDELRVADGSGLSRYNLISPELLAALLAHMTRSPNWELWYSSLPTAGQTGTLARRLGSTPLAGNVHAKTGTLSGVRSLSGYLTTAAGERLIFSVLVNNHLRSASAVDRVVDAALLEVYGGR